MHNKVLAIIIGLGMLSACTQHEVKLQAPDKPIEINLNVNIDHRVKVEIDKDLDKAMNNSSIF